MSEMRARSQSNGDKKSIPLIDIGRKRIYLYDNIDEYVAAEIAYNIPVLDDHNPDNPKPITVLINSPGGFVDSFASILSVLDNTKSPIHIDITGTAYSAAAYISLCGNHIRISKFAHMMFHHQSWGYTGSRDEHETYLQANGEHEDRMLKELFKRTKMLYKDFQKRIKGVDFYVSPNQALKYGFVDEIY